MLQILAIFYGLYAIGKNRYSLLLTQRVEGRPARIAGLILVLNPLFALGVFGLTYTLVAIGFFPESFLSLSYRVINPSVLFICLGVAHQVAKKGIASRSIDVLKERKQG